jgi:hypothetical protein
VDEMEFYLVEFKAFVMVLSIKEENVLLISLIHLFHITSQVAEERN